MWYFTRTDCNENEHAAPCTTSGEEPNVHQILGHASAKTNPRFPPGWFGLISGCSLGLDSNVGFGVRAGVAFVYLTVVRKVVYCLYYKVEILVVVMIAMLVILCCVVD